MNFIRKFIAAPPKGEVATIPSGRLFLARSLLSPKGALECLYNDSVLIIKQSSASFCYQLCVIRAYQEGELSSNFADEDEEDEDDDAHDNEPNNNDERVFFLTPELNVRVYLKNDGTMAIKWADISGDTGDCYEFVVDEEIKNNDVDSFMLTLYRCLYEQINEKSAANVAEEELRMQFSQPLSPIVDSPQALFELLRGYSSKRTSAADLLKSNHMPAVLSVGKLRADRSHYFEKSVTVFGDIICSYEAELRIFDETSEAFSLLVNDASIAIAKDKSGVFWLLSTTPNFSFSVILLKKVKPTFYLDYLGLSFDYTPTYHIDEADIKLFIKLKTVEEFESFKHEFLNAMYNNVSQNDEGGNVLDVVQGLRSVKLSNSDSRIGEHASSIVRSKAGLTREGRVCQKAVSLNELQSHHNGKSTSQDSGDSSEIFLGAFKKTADGIVLVSEITSIEDTQGKTHKSALDLQDLRDKTLFLRNDLP